VPYQATPTVLTIRESDVAFSFIVWRVVLLPAWFSTSLRAQAGYVSSRAHEPHCMFVRVC